MDNIDNWATHVIYISNGICEDKKTIKDFKNNDSLYNSIKMKFINDDNLKKKKNNIESNKNVLGPQGGWSSGRSQNL